MKSLTKHISEKLVVNKDYNAYSKFDELISIIEKLRSHGDYHVVDSKKLSSIPLPHDEPNKRKVIETFDDMDMCIYYSAKVCNRKFYTDTFNKCIHIINHEKDSLDIIWDNWDEWTDNGYKRKFTIVDSDGDNVVMVVNDSENIDNTYILVGM